MVSLREKKRNWILVCDYKNFSATLGKRSLYSDVPYILSHNKELRERYSSFNDFGMIPSNTKRLNLPTITYC